MTPRERLLRTMRGERADRVPLVLPGCQVPSTASLGQIEDPLRRTIAERVGRQMHFGVGINSHVNRYLVTPPQRIRTKTEDLPTGRRRTHGVIDTPRGELTFLTEWNPESPQTTWTLKYPCESREDIDKIASVPWELPEGLRPPQLDHLPADFAERGIVRTGVSSPFVCVGGMMRYERFLELCATDLPLVQELTEICRQRVLDCLRVLFAKPGIEYVWMGGSEWVTPPMASPRIYDALVQEQERDLIDFVHAHSGARDQPPQNHTEPHRRGGYETEAPVASRVIPCGSVASSVVHIHCHGHIRDALPKTVARGGDYTEPCEPPPDGDITMAEAKALAAGRITLGGNIEARVLCHGDEEAVEQAVRAAFEGGKERFVLAPTEGPSPRLSEQECRNYLRLIDVWEELSPIA